MYTYSDEYSLLEEINELLKNGVYTDSDKERLYHTICSSFIEHKMKVPAFVLTTKNGKLSLHLVNNL